MGCGDGSPRSEKEVRSCYIYLHHSLEHLDHRRLASDRSYVLYAMFFDFVLSCTVTYSSTAASLSSFWSAYAACDEVRLFTSVSCTI